MQQPLDWLVYRWCCLMGIIHSFSVREERTHVGDLQHQIFFLIVLGKPSYLCFFPGRTALTGQDIVCKHQFCLQKSLYGQPTYRIIQILQLSLHGPFENVTQYLQDQNTRQVFDRYQDIQAA